MKLSLWIAVAGREMWWICSCLSVERGSSHLMECCAVSNIGVVSVMVYCLQYAGVCCLLQVWVSRWQGDKTHQLHTAPQPTSVHECNKLFTDLLPAVCRAGAQRTDH